MEHYRKVCIWHICDFLGHCTLKLSCLVVQILFVAERDHWVATSYHQDEIRLYDSKCSPNLHGSLQEQIALIYKEAANGNTLTVKAIPVQQQTGGEDCGLFSIAYAYHAALGEDLLGVTFDQSKMRDHLIACLIQKCLKLFPPALERRGIKRNKMRIFHIHLICICKLPESSDSNVIQCDQCSQWYHFRCVNIEQKCIPNTWLCSNCYK